MADRTDYTHLDELLFEAIERAPRRFDSLRAEFEAEFDKHAPRDRWGNANGWRAIDRRLQALRKAGRIKADPKLGWVKASLSSSSGGGNIVSTDATKPRAFTKEETQQHFLDHVRALARYWGTLPGKTPQERCEGLAFSILVMFDGGSSGMPAIDLAVCPHQDDKQFHIDEGSNWYEPGLVFNDDVSLHDMFYGKEPS